MGKVIFEFDDQEDELREIDLVVGRHKLVCALYDIQNLRREIYKGYADQHTISVKDNRVITSEEFKAANMAGEMISGSKEYISTDYILDELDRALENVYQLLD